MMGWCQHCCNSREFDPDPVNGLFSCSGCGKVLDQYNFAIAAEASTANGLQRRSIRFGEEEEEVSDWEDNVDDFGEDDYEEEDSGLAYGNGEDGCVYDDNEEVGSGMIRWCRHCCKGTEFVRVPFDIGFLSCSGCGRIIHEHNYYGNEEDGYVYDDNEKVGYAMIRWCQQCWKGTEFVLDPCYESLSCSCCGKVIDEHNTYDGNEDDGYVYELLM